MAKRPDKKTIVIPAMAGVEGKKGTLPEGEYLVEVTEVNEKEGNAGNYLEWVLTVASKEGKGAKLFHITSLAPQALWNLRGVLEALGIDPPDDETEMDHDDLVGNIMNVLVEHEKYEGKNRARIVDYWPAEGKAAAKDEDDEKPAKASSRKPAEDDEPEDKNARRRERRAERRGKAASDDVDEKPTAKAAAKKSSKLDPLSEDEIASMDEESLGEVVAEYKLDVDLDELATMRKKRAAVTAALEEAELLAA